MTSLAKFVFIDVREKDTPFTTDDEKHLTLAYENLDDIPINLVASYAKYVCSLDLSHNNFSQLKFLSEFDNLTSLILDHNNIDSQVVLPPLPKLHLLWMNHNQVADLFPFIRNLYTSCPDLRYLSLMGNAAAPSYFNGGTVYDHLQYRLFVISWFPNLIHLDDRQVTSDQREEAYRLFRRPLFERVTSNNMYFRTLQKRVSKMFTDWEQYFTDRRPNAVV